MNEATARFLAYLASLDYASIDKDDLGKELWDAIESARKACAESGISYESGGDDGI